MQVNTDSVAILTRQVLKSEVEVLKTRLDTPGAGPGDPRWLGDMTDLRAGVRVLERRIEELEGKVDG
jgi:hypothetical protein